MDEIKEIVKMQLMVILKDYSEGDQGAAALGGLVFVTKWLDNLEADFIFKYFSVTCFLLG